MPTRRHEPPKERMRLFRILRDNLVRERAQYGARELILCPVCLREMTVDQLDAVEHIIPRNILKSDPLAMKKIHLSGRAGLTALCHHERETKGGANAPNGCNGWKGQKFDRLFKGMLQGRKVAQWELTPRHRVAILIMAYLGAFQRFGYGYILRPELDDIRLQFDYPDQSMTPWLWHTHVQLTPVDPNYQPWATTSGLPFIFADGFASKRPLDIFFRRFSALLPSGLSAIQDNPELLNAPVLSPPS